MEKEKNSIRSLEDGWHKFVCMDHSHPHIFKGGKCINCGKDEPIKLTRGGIHMSRGTKERIVASHREKFHDEIELSPQYQKIFDFAVNYANKWDMFRKGLYKPTPIEMDQFKAEGLTIRLDNRGNIISVKKAGEEDNKLVEHDELIHLIKKEETFCNYCKYEEAYDDGDGRVDAWCDHKEVNVQNWAKGTFFYKDMLHCPFYEEDDD